VKFRKKPVEVEATQWFENGDHPDDFPAGAPALCPMEGRVVRYFRHPEASGDRSCRQCNHLFHQHGWIDTLEGGHIVCPGDWIITGVHGEHYPCKPDIFEKTYERAD
jgi:hypothetical protein